MVGETDPSHPSMENAEQWRGVKFYDTVRVDPGDSRVVARLSDGTPLLLDEKIGEGRVMLLTSGLDNITNDFPLHAIFVPFVEQTARYLSGTERRSGSRLVDSYLELRTAKEQAVGVEVVDPAGPPASFAEASQLAAVVSAHERRLLPAPAGKRPSGFGRGERRPARIRSRRYPRRDFVPVAGKRKHTSSQGRDCGASSRTKAAVSPLVVRHDLGTCGGGRGIAARQPLSRDAGGGAMSTRDELNSYIGQLQQRLRVGAALRGAAILAGTALVTTVVLVVILNAFAFSRVSVGSARAVLILRTHSGGGLFSRDPAVPAQPPERGGQGGEPLPPIPTAADHLCGARPEGT